MTEAFQIEQKTTSRMRQGNGVNFADVKCYLKVNMWRLYCGTTSKHRVSSTWK